MSNTENRIKLAEFVGWEWHHLVDYPNKDSGQWSLHGMFRDWSIKSDLPFNPYEDANDCEALIERLRYCGHEVEFRFKEHSRDFAGVVFIHIWNLDTEMHERGDYDNWKQGIAELTLRIIDENDSP